MYSPSLDQFLAKMGVLGHFEVKNYVNYLNFFPSAKFKS